jgi:hypothetical protein
VAVATSGSITVGSSSTYKPKMDRVEITTITSVCPAGQALLSMTYSLQIADVFDSYIVGPRTLADIAFSSPFYNNSVQNCYNETVYSMQSLGCFSSVCYTQIVTRTGCRVLTTDGAAFNNCTRGFDSDRITAMKSDIPFPTTLDMVHSMWINNYRCLSAGVNCTLANQSPIGIPDEFDSTLKINIYPQTSINIQFDVYAGLMPTPTDDNINNLEVLTKTDTTYVNSTVDTFQSQLRWNGVLSFVIGMLSPTLRSLATLTIDLDSPITITPLDPTGTPIVGGKVLTFGDVFPYLTYVPKQALQRGLCTLCTTHPVVSNASAFDGFSIPVLTLRGLSPGNGYAIGVTYSFTMPLSTVTPNQGLLAYHPQHRKLLQAQQQQVSVKTGGFTFNFLINESQNPTPVTSVVGNYSIVPLPSLQIQLHSFLDTSYTGLQGASSVDMAKYIASYVPAAIAATYQIDINQIINVNVMFDAQNVLKSSRQLLALSQLSFLISFVIIPSPLTNTTLITMTAFTAPTSVAVFQAQLYGIGLILDPTQPIKVINVLVAPNTWYTSSGVYITVTNDSDMYKTATNIILPIILFTFIGIFIIIGYRAYKKEEGFEAVLTVDKE